MARIPRLTGTQVASEPAPIFKAANNAELTPNLTAFGGGTVTAEAFDAQRRMGGAIANVGAAISDIQEKERERADRSVVNGSVVELIKGKQAIENEALSMKGSGALKYITAGEKKYDDLVSKISSSLSSQRQRDAFAQQAFGHKYNLLTQMNSHGREQAELEETKNFNDVEEDALKNYYAMPVRKDAVGELSAKIALENRLDERRQFLTDKGWSKETIDNNIKKLREGAIAGRILKQLDEDRQDTIGARRLLEMERDYLSQDTINKLEEKIDKEGAKVVGREVGMLLEAKYGKDYVAAKKDIRDGKIEIDGAVRALTDDEAAKVKDFLDEGEKLAEQEAEQNKNRAKEWLDDHVQQHGSVRAATGAAAAAKLPDGSSVADHLTVSDYEKYARIDRARESYALRRTKAVHSAVVAEAKMRDSILEDRLYANPEEALELGRKRVVGQFYDKAKADAFYTRLEKYHKSSARVVAQEQLKALKDAGLPVATVETPSGTEGATAADQAFAKYAGGLLDRVVYAERAKAGPVAQNQSEEIAEAKRLSRPVAAEIARRYREVSNFQNAQQYLLKNELAMGSINEEGVREAFVKKYDSPGNFAGSNSIAAAQTLLGEYTRGKMSPLETEIIAVASALKDGNNIVAHHLAHMIATKTWKVPAE